MIRIASVDMSSPGFGKSLKCIPPEKRAEALSAIKALLQDPMPQRIRFEKLVSYKNPAIYTIHITRNHSHKASFELIGATAVMRKVGTHKEIDREP